MDISLHTGSAVALWASLNLFLMLILSGLVVRQRRRHRIAVGDGGIPELARALRAFGNASEYVPAGIAALAVLSIAGADQSVIHVVGAALFLGRLIHAVGLSLSLGPSLSRTIGMLLTWLAILIAAAALLMYAI